MVRVLVNEKGTIGKHRCHLPGGTVATGFDGTIGQPPWETKTPPRGRGFEFDVRGIYQPPP